MQPTHVYIGPDCTYPQLAYADGIAPFTCTSGITAVDFGDLEPPHDGHWQPLKGKKALPHARPDNAVPEAPSAPADTPAAPAPQPAPDAAAPTADTDTTTGS